VSALRGRRVLVTRQRNQSESLASLLEARGAEVLQVASIEIVAPEDLRPLDGALEALDRYDWVVLTSATAVKAVLSRLTVLGLYPKLGGGTGRRRIASVGPSTTAALRASFPEDRVALEPAHDARAAGLVAAFAGEKLVGRRILVPASSLARTELAEGLREQGAVVDVVAAYRPVEPPGLKEAVLQSLSRGFDLALFASPSAVEAFARAAGERAKGLAVVVIGPTTEAAAREAGLDVRGVAAPSTEAGLLEAAERALA
jgi:uroporphyrinogen-III synthase